APGAVGLRDDSSRQLLLAAGVPPERLRVSADPVVTLRPAPADSVRALLPPRDGPLVAFCLRDLPNNPNGLGPGYLLPVAAQKRLGISGGGREAHARRVAAFQIVLAQAADHLIVEHDARVLFVPFWPGRDDAFAGEVRARMQHSDRAHSVEAPLAPAQGSALLRATDLVVAMRLHALVFAATGGVPVVGFGYARKVRGFMERLGQGDLVLDPYNVEWPLVQAALDRAWSQRSAIRGALPGSMAALQRAAAQDREVTARLLRPRSRR
ncbi:MAG TPA: polysaccharide pyruvyl transferase family protein, partial [Chloroflexia bacterium]|nr:polysaccharide pyruvyl transferase family protein [Chloroflexia bacterium]